VTGFWVLGSELPPLQLIFVLQSFLACSKEMRPQSSIQVILLNNVVDDEGNYIRLRVEINSWVSLMLGKSGGHAKYSAKHGGATIGGSYKAKVLGFRINLSMVAIFEVQVQHAYMKRQLDIDPRTPIQDAICNCKF